MSHVQRPSRLLESVEVSIPRPREWKVRGSGHFVGLCTHTWDMMKKERLSDSWRQ